MNFDAAAQMIIDAMPTMTEAQREHYRAELNHMAVVEGSKVAEAYLTQETAPTFGLFEGFRARPVYDEVRDEAGRLISRKIRR